MAQLIPEAYCRQAADPVKNWYLENLNYEIKCDFVNFDEKWLGNLSDFERRFGLFKPNTLNDFKRNQERIKNQFSDLYHKKANGVIKRETIKKYVSLLAPVYRAVFRILRNDKTEIKEPFRSYPYNTIFILPSLSPILYDIELEPLICHEFFHIVQYELGFLEKYPLIEEGAASLIETAYVCSKKDGLSIDSLEEHHNPGFERDLQLYRDISSEYYVYKTLSNAGFRSTLKVLEKHLSLSSSSEFSPQTIKCLLENEIQHMINEQCIESLSKKEIDMAL